MYEYGIRFKRIIDGDTFVCDIDLGFGIWLMDQHCRLFGVDTPEKNTTEGKAATHAAKEWFAVRQNTAERFSIEVLQKADKYGRRLVHVKTDKSPTTLNVEVMKSLGVYEYFGGTKRKKVTAVPVIEKAPL
jgi:endonuclease YncB( thermonuclease family)